MAVQHSIVSLVVLSCLSNTASIPLTEDPAAAEHVSLTYFNGKGRAEQIRLLMTVANIEFQDKKIESIQSLKVQTLGDASPLAFDQVPVIQHNGANIAQTAAEMQYIGELAGLSGDTPLERAEALSMMIGSEEMRDKIVFKQIHGHGAPTRAEADKLMDHFERRLRQQAKKAETAGTETGPFLLGPKFTYADVALYDCLASVAEVFPNDVHDIWQKFPRSKTLYDAVAALPKVREYEQHHLRNSTEW
eukprot:gnl/TRDRNA2_/TRDRNA2_41967_c0_seq2.p1 gnl/TRDRNA2_/TRDRNA2_41967_c0~~gnl/TRDRNA2_/TRDRNA2_41967_c0_seq2.p1  ORF type:complete len:247 (+),score=39.10 gnl/TRDRNA2_/TRDRNA2_41967_c0_seq2:75-815(+)